MVYKRESDTGIFLKSEGDYSDRRSLADTESLRVSHFLNFEVLEYAAILPASW